MKMIVLEQEALFKSIAAEIAAVVEKKPDAVIGITAVDVPEQLLDAIASCGTDYSGVTAFNACEYIGEAADGIHSEAQRLREALYEKTSFHAVFVPADGTDYENAIRAAGGLDLVLLGIGERGHVAFCEPGADFSSGTYTVKLADVTRKQAADRFGSLEETPTHGITMGIGTLLNARRILLVACGADKANAAQKTIQGRPENYIPASFLQLHSDVTVYLDPEAAEKL